MNRARTPMAAGIACGTLAAAAFVEGFLSEPFQLDVQRVTIASSWLPAGFDGVTIAQLSDLHLHRVSAAYSMAIDVIRRERPHLVVITGDLVDRPDDATVCLDYLRDLRVAAGAPVVAVFGNWDHRAFPTRKSIEAWRQLLHAETGIRVLVNENTRLRRRGDRMWLAGTDDPYFGHADLDASLAGIPDDDRTILLSHAPEDIEEIAVEPSVRLVLVGHTHGGQVRLPFLGALRVPSRYGTRFASGLFQVGGTLMYVNAGMGTSHVPVRFLCRPELTLLTLTSAAGNHRSA